jgi:hypothetical protein
LVLGQLVDFPAALLGPVLKASRIPGTVVIRNEDEEEGKISYMVRQEKKNKGMSAAHALTGPPLSHNKKTAPKHFLWNLTQRPRFP